jgi:hypothetical protein
MKPYTSIKPTPSQLYTSPHKKCDSASASLISRASGLVGLLHELSECPLWVDTVDKGVESGAER